MSVESYFSNLQTKLFSSAWFVTNRISFYPQFVCAFSSSSILKWKYEFMRKVFRLEMLKILEYRSFVLWFLLHCFHSSSISLSSFYANSRLISISNMCQVTFVTNFKKYLIATKKYVTNVVFCISVKFAKIECLIFLK